ncbi:MAG: YceI family protein [Bacteroidetes bacterium]|jgi:polyisoprenoid-binding protein YceI|nr:YceI family protein [Bacteroidota bacterium]
MKNKWTIDPMHSEVQFKIRHLVISTVSGSFTKFSAEVETDGENFESAQIKFSADANSITTGAEQRDGHLNSADFFDSANHPTIDFVSTSFTKVSDANYKLNGNLSIRGITKPVELDVEFGGIMKDPYGNIKAGFDVSGKIKRKDFGVSWDVVTEAGGIMLSDEVKLIANVQFAKVVVEEMAVKA